ncbi:unnamed protein product [Gadus morhua 'NCC']
MVDLWAASPRFTSIMFLHSSGLRGPEMVLNQTFYYYCDLCNILCQEPMGTESFMFPGSLALSNERN